MSAAVAGTTARLYARHRRDLPGLGADADLPGLGQLLSGPPGPGAVVIGTALHGMDESAALRSGAELPRRAAESASTRRDRRLWLGLAAWQQQLREVLEEFSGPTTGTCGSDAAAIESRVAVLTDLGLDVPGHPWRIAALRVRDGGNGPQPQISASARAAP